MIRVGFRHGLGEWLNLGVRASQVQEVTDLELKVAALGWAVRTLNCDAEKWEKEARARGYKDPQ